MKNAIKVVVFVVLLTASSILFEHVYPDSLSSKILDDALDECQDILIVGDSFLSRVSNEDSDERSMADMIVDEINLTDGRCVSVSSNAAAHLGLYEGYSDYIHSKEIKLDMIVIPISMRTFSNTWDTRPNLQFTHEIYRMKHARSDALVFLDRFNALFTDSPEQFERADRNWKDLRVYYNDTDIGNVGEFIYTIYGNEENLNELMRNKLIYYYLFPLDQNHHKFDSLAYVVGSFRKEGTKVLLYIPAIDYQTGEKYVGEKFVPIVNQNRMVVHEKASVLDVPILDMTYDEPTSEFDYDWNPKEYLKQDGRLRAAKNISRFIKSNLNESI